MIDPKTIVKSPTPNKPDPIPINIIFFPSHLCRKARAVRKLTARVPQLAALNVLKFPEGRSRSNDNVRELFAETLEILMRVAGGHATTVNHQREISRHSFH